jgi:hypothetical protein
MLRITHNHTGPSSIRHLDLSTRLLQRNISSSSSTSALLTPLSRSIKLTKTPAARSSSPSTASPTYTSTPSSISSLFSHGSKGRIQQRRDFRSSTVNYQSRAIDEFGVLGKDGVNGSTGSTASEGRILSGQILRPQQRKMMTLEEAMGDIKPLELSPELTMLKEQVTTGAKVIDGKAIAK